MGGGGGGGGGICECCVAIPFCRGKGCRLSGPGRKVDGSGVEEDACWTWETGGIGWDGWFEGSGGVLWTLQDSALETYNMNKKNYSSFPVTLQPA